LEEVIDRYKAGARTIKKGKLAGVGSKNQLKSKVVSGFKLTVKKPRDVLNFLKILTEVWSISREHLIFVKTLLLAHSFFLLPLFSWLLTPGS